MYCAGPPGSNGAGGADGSLGRPLCLTAAGRRAFEGSSDAALDPMLRVYLTDMVAPYGLALREDLLDQGRGQSYGEMAGAVVAQTVPPGQPVDLVVLAFAVHDVIPGRSVAAHLSYLCPGAPMAFAVCDQGAAAPFTGLRLIGEYTRAGGCQRALLVVVEQQTLHYEPAGPGGMAARNAAVALLCGAAGPGRLEPVRQHAGVPAEQVSDLLGRELAALAAGRDDVTLIAGSGLSRGRRPDVPAVHQVIVAAAGQPVTGVWWELAGGLPDWAAAGRRVLLADYEPELGYLCVSAIDLAGSPARVVPSGTARQAPWPQTPWQQTPC